VAAVGVEVRLAVEFPRYAGGLGRASQQQFPIDLGHRQRVVEVEADGAYHEREYGVA